MSQKIVSVHRLRLPNGKTVSSPKEFEDYILEVILKHRPSTPKEISNILAKSTKQIHRYLNNLKEQNKIEKVDGTDKYKIKNSKHTANSIQQQRDIENYADFENCESVKKWRQNNNSNALKDKISWFRNLCFGQIIEDFKINPDYWIKEETTPHVVQLLKEKQGKTNAELLPPNQRQAIRSFIIYGLEQVLTQAEGERLGISGEKPKPTLSTLHMTDDQYEKAKLILKAEFPEKDYVKFGYRYGTFCRPSSIYLVKTDQLSFYDRVVNYIEINGEKITDNKVIQALSKDYKIQAYTHRACSVEHYEPKTQTWYTKYIFDQEIATALERYTEKRKQDGFKYLFWDKNDTEFTDSNYTDTVKYTVLKDNEQFKKLLLEVGFSKDSFGKSLRANYALRHFGVQKWLRITDYNYGFVSEMGWEDIETLKLWYGKRTAQALQQKVSEVMYL